MVIIIFKKSKIKEWKDKFLNLKSQIDYWLINKTNKTIEIIQLYYDE